MLRKKQEIIDVYGHFFVLCARYSQGKYDPAGGYLGRVFNEVSHYGQIGARDYFSNTTPPIQLEIWEFFGKPKMFDRHDIGVLQGLHHSDRKNSLFTSLEEAENKATEIRAQHNAMYEELRQIKAGFTEKEAESKRLTFDLDTPPLPTVLKLIPDEFAFPDFIRNDDKIYVFLDNVGDRALRIFETEISDVTLYPSQIGSTNEPFEHEYILNASIWIPREDNSQIAIRRDFRIGADGEQWMYQHFNSNDVGFTGGSPHLARTKQEAERRAREYAEKVYSNIRHMLPDATVKAEPITAAPAGP